MSHASAFVGGDKKAFCRTLSEFGGSAPFAEAATSGKDAAELKGPLKKLAKAAPSKSLKSALKTLAKLFNRIGRGEEIEDLGTKDIAKLNKAMTKFSVFVARNCTSG